MVSPLIGNAMAYPQTGSGTAFLLTGSVAILEETALTGNAVLTGSEALTGDVVLTGSEATLEVMVLIGEPQHCELLHPIPSAGFTKCLFRDIVPSLLDRSP